MIGIMYGALVSIMLSISKAFFGMDFTIIFGFSIMAMILKDSNK